MAQSQSTTNEGYAELAKLIAGEDSSEIESVVCIANSCTANEAQTYAGLDKFTGSGLSIANADTVATIQTSCANDTVQVDHVFTANAAANAYGFAVCNNDDDVAVSVCCFTAVVVMSSSDTLTVQMKHQVKAD